MFVETSRLTLRDLQPSDFEALLSITSDPAVSSRNDYLPADRELLLRWLSETLLQEAQQPRSSHHCAVVLRASEQIVGWIGFNLSEARTVEFGYAVASPHWNLGYMTEAVRGMLSYCFDTLRVQRVTAFHLSENPASGRVLQKAGMWRDDATVPDREPTEVHYRVTAADWSARHPNQTPLPRG